jgi:hypothetical protein
VQPLAPQIEEAVFQADILGVIRLARHRHRQFLRLRLNRHAAGEDLDLAAGEVGIGGAGGARLDRAIDRHDRFDAQAFEDRQRRRIAVCDDLGNAVVITQIDEQHAAMVAPTMQPTRKADSLTDVTRPERGAVVGTIGVHGV